MEHEKRVTRYSREFKEQAVALAEESEKPVGQIEAELGISRGQISRWRRELANSNGRHGPRDRADVEAENRRLRKENAELREEREILRKATAIFSQYRK